MTTAKKSTDVQVREIPVEMCYLSPQETRKTIDQATLQELAASIALNGVQEPLLVRPVDVDCMSGEPLSGAARVGDGFEIVAGQRRWLASKLIGKSTCPCIVREMSDDEAAELRIVSNEQREDLRPLEQALAFNARLCAPGATVETVAAKLGLSPGYVGRRLKLLDAIEPVREALKFGAIDVGHALELARLSERQQQDLLEWLNVGYEAPDEDEDDDSLDRDEDEEGYCKYCESDDEDLKNSGRTWSNEKRTVCSAPECTTQAEAEAAMGGLHPTRETVAELRKRIARTELRILGEAPFPLDDEIPPMSCVECPKRSFNAQGLFDDILRDACTDSDCYGTKLKVWVKAELEKADRSGAKLVMLSDGSAQDKAAVSKWNVVVGADCSSQEAAIWVSGARLGHLVQICRDKKCAIHGENAPVQARSGSSKGSAMPKLSAADKAKAEAQKVERQKLLKKVEVEKTYRERLWNELITAPVSDKGEDHIVRQACAQIASQGGGLVARVLGLSDNAFDYGRRSEVLDHIAAKPYMDLVRAAGLALVVGDVAVGDYTVLRGQKPELMEALAALFGIDVAAIRANRQKAATKKAVKKSATKPAPKKEKKVISKKPAKKAAKKAAKK